MPAGIAAARPGSKPGADAPLGPATRSRRGRDAHGAATSLAVALLTPVFVVLAFAAVQAAMWSHARTEARVVARDTAALVARSGVDPGDAQASAVAVLTADTDLRDVLVVVTTGPGIVTVTVTGDAPGILRGTSSGVSVTSAVPIEEITP
jgi:hypothetical protein